jgi:aryl-alcohol dehydrogenase-like predicted oxidoreductase
MATEVPYRTLGKTGERVSAIGLGGWHLGLPTVSEAVAIRLIRTALDRGLNFLDNSWDYFNGLSELRMGKALKDGYRKKAFLMTKIDGRSKKEAASQIEQSLLRLGTDTIDLVQHHEVLRFEDPNRIFDAEGAHAAMLDARKAGKIRYIGFTGHKDPHIHLYMLDVARENGFHFDTVQMPLNVMDAHFRSFGKLVVPRLVEEGVGILGMKSMANGIILQSKIVTPVECLHYALSQPTSVVITGIDSTKILNQAFRALRSLPKFTDAARTALLDRTRSAAAKGKWEPFKTSSIFDGTAANPKWLGEEPARLQRIMPE